MASQIHKARTGRALRITEDIIIREEMYEEEPTPSWQRMHKVAGVCSPDTPFGDTIRSEETQTRPSLKNMVSNHLAQLDVEWRKNNIHQLFADAFPHIASPSFSSSSSSSSSQAALSRRQSYNHNISGITSPKLPSEQWLDLDVRRLSNRSEYKTSQSMFTPELLLDNQTDSISDSSPGSLVVSPAQVDPSDTNEAACEIFTNNMDWDSMDWDAGISPAQSEMWHAFPLDTWGIDKWNVCESLSCIDTSL